MLGLLTRDRTSVVGVDLGTCSLRAVQLLAGGSGWGSHHWVNIETEPATADPPPMDHAAHLQLAFGPGTFTGDRTALLLSPPDVEFRLLDVPAALMGKSSAELRNALQFELDRQLPWPAAESEVAAWPVKPDASGNASTMVAAARTSSVRQRLDVLDGQGFRCLHADIVPNAMIRVGSPPRGEENNEYESPIWGVLDIGFRSARFYLIHADRPVYARVVSGGGKEVTEQLAEALHVDFRIAEQYKRIYGIHKSDRGFRSVGGGLTRINEDQLPAVLYAILRPMIEDMVQDIERSFHFALGQLPGVAAGVIYMVGGGARLAGLTDVLSDHLGVPVLLPDPESVLSTAGSTAGNGGHSACTPADFTVLAPCVGLAMMGEGGS